MNGMSVSTAQSAPRSRPSRRLLAIGASVVAFGVIALGAGAAYVFSTQPRQIAVSDFAGTAQFNFRVTGIPVPGTVPGVQVQARWNPADLAHATATVQVPLQKLSTGIALRDTHAKNYLGAAQHPQATFQLQSLAGPSRLKAGQQAEAAAQGVFTLNGVAQPLSAKVTLHLDASGQKLDVTTRFNVVFAKHQISIPGADPQTDVTVKFRLAAQP